jgi:hypothetical protein
MSPTLLRILLRRRTHVTAFPATRAGHTPVAAARTRRTEFVELNARDNDGYRVSLEWHRDTGETQIAVRDIRTASQIVFPVSAADAGDAFRHPFTAFLAAVRTRCEPDDIAG